MSIIAAGTTTTTALSSTGNTDGTLQFQVNGTTPSVTLNTLGAVGVGSTPAYGSSGQVLTSAGSTAAPTWTTIAASQWTTSGSNIYYNTGNVAIKTTTFSSISGTVGTLSLGGTNPYASGGIAYQVNGTTKGYHYIDVDNMTHQSVSGGHLFYATNIEYFRIGPAGQIGLSGANYGSSGQVLTSAGSGAAPTWSTPSAGAVTLLATVTASNSATVSLETGISSTYDDYFVTFTDVTASSDGVKLQVKLKFSGTYADAYASVGYYSGSDNSVVNKLNESVCVLNRAYLSVYTSTGKNMGGELYFNRTANSKYQMLRFRSSTWCPDNYGTNIVADSTGSAFWTNTNPTQGIQFYMSAGNIYSGTFRLYGIQNS